MISSIEWIPAGVADPNPKKYELSTTEQELIRLMQDQGNLDEQVMEAREKVSMKAKLPKIENNLPPDLRMDDYSSDEEDEDEGKAGAAIGRLLVGTSGSMAEDTVDDSEQEVAGEGDRENSPGNDSDNESDDDLNDVPDTREYEPVDVEGLQAMGLSHVGMSSSIYMSGLGEEERDDDSEAEDVALTADDALLVVAKTEDVSSTFMLDAW
jgi:hypothetical protein